MIPIALLTLQSRKKSLVWWSLGILAFIALNLAFYPSLRDQTAQLEQSLADIPEAVRGFLSDTGEFVTPVGYLSSQVYYFLLPLLLSIFTISIGTSLIGKEEREGTLELLATKPLSRSKILTGKLTGAALCLFALGSISAITVIVLTRIVDIPVSISNILLTTLMSVLFSAFIGVVAFSLTCVGRARSASVGIATLLAIGGYILSSLLPIAEWLQWPARLMPFYYYTPGAILAGSFSVANLLVFLGAIAALLAVSFYMFQRRDITA